MTGLTGVATLLLLSLLVRSETPSKSETSTKSPGSRSLSGPNKQFLCLKISGDVKTIES